MHTTKLIKFVNQFWGNSVIPGLSEFIRIPAKSPAYDADWEKHGALDAAAHFMATWADSQNIAGLKAEVVHAKNRTPLLYVEIAGNTKNTALFYGHLDKMPESNGWDKHLGPWKPVIRHNHLYGRGSADDGYGFFSLITAIKFLQKEQIPHGHIVVLIESCEESDSADLGYYLDRLKKHFPRPNLIICLDVGAADYHRLWCTDSLRGIVDGTLSINVLKKSIHSGVASGVVPSSFRIARQLLDRIEDHNTGKVLIKSAHTKIPKTIHKNVQHIAKIFGKKIFAEFPLIKNVEFHTNDPKELLLNRTWRPTLSVIGAEGLPAIKDAASALRPHTTLQLSLRLPPGTDPKKVAKELKQVLEKNPPHAAKVKFTLSAIMTGWSERRLDAWLKKAIQHASEKYFGRPPLTIGCGGSIGVIPLLQSKFPKAQLLLTGAAGPDSNEHGPNESLYLPAAKKVTCCIAEILAQHATHK
ncbi:MAG: M20/M25/M40 family metallo-hydrolase [Gammaproteobacteria bacterium]|nr:M20/M25/M40 family metallo-hydrolase [Gammaproteobacteria bacterium]